MSVRTLNAISVGCWIMSTVCSEFISVIYGWSEKILLFKRRFFSKVLYTSSRIRVISVKINNKKTYVIYPAVSEIAKN